MFSDRRMFSDPLMFSKMLDAMPNERRPRKSAYGRLAAPLALFVAWALPVCAAPVNFAHDIAPIVYKNCAPCHRPGEAGPFSLLTYQDVKGHARQIADVTRRRYMPPWAPEAGYGDFVGERRLTDAEIRLIADWASQGASEGNASETPPPPNFTEGWQFGPPDVIIEAQHAYTLPASGPDVYWNFILPTAFGSTRYVRALEIRPGDKRVVHHANLYVDRAHSTRRQEIAEGAGFPGMDVAIDRTTTEPDDGHFLFWKPGGAPYVEPDGFAWRIDPGNDLVLNAHLQPTGKPEQVRPSIGLYFTDKPPEHFPMLVQLEHDGALNIPPGNRDFLVSDDFRLPLDVDVLAVYPHAHYLGHLLEGYATLPSGERKWLIRIPDWDPNWQGAYHYREPVFLPQGSIISMRYHYDNSAANPRNPNQPPRRVEGGNQATDEMGHLWLQVLPRKVVSSKALFSKTGPAEKGDRRMELEEAVMRHRLEKYPGDFEAHFQLGAIRLARLDPAEALVMLQAAIRIQPDHAEARNMLGSALVAMGRNTEAIEQFRAAIRTRADYTNARYNLARALARAGKYDEAVDRFEEVSKEFPRDVQVRNEWGELYLRQRKLADALEQFDAALAIDPSDKVALKNREAVLSESPELALRSAASKTEEATEIRWVRPRRPLPEALNTVALKAVALKTAELKTLDGKAWKLADLEGKVVLINIWATWCDPCRAELRELQKLYDELKGRQDAAVITFNADDDPAKAAAFMSEHRYTFPVVLANDLVDAYLSVVFLPQTWFLDSKGTLQWIHEGYDGNANWQQMMTAKLNEVLQAQH
jgi:tetratricopeptide (TPR) repeat protein/mono/diheme cytochrome c family protein